MINDSMIKSGAPTQPLLSIFSHISQVILQYILGFLPFVESGHLKDFPLSSSTRSFIFQTK